MFEVMDDAQSQEALTKLREAIRDVADFPQPGILFKDITPVLADEELLAACAKLMAKRCLLHGQNIDKVVGIDARGFIFGALVARELEAGFVPVRKAGKLPWQTHECSYALEYGEASLEIHRDALQPGESVVLVDDLLATGGTAAAARQLAEQLGVEPLCACFFIELAFLDGQQKLEGLATEALLSFSS